MTRHEAPAQCGMPSAAPELLGALVGGIIGLVVNWLLWRWLIRPHRT